MHKQFEKSIVKENQSLTKQTKKIVIPPTVEDHLIPNIHCDLINPYYICNIDSQYLRSVVHKEQPKDGERINYKTMMQDDDDFGDLPSRKSSIFSSEDITIRKTAQINNDIEFLKIIKRQNGSQLSEKKNKKKSEQDSFKVQLNQFKSLTKQKRQQQGTPLKNKIIISCNCKKSKCLKSYCECFVNKLKCTQNCKCIGCENMDIKTSKKKKQETVGYCNCKKTRCIKKYCQCYNQGIACNSGCRCNDCQNI